MEKSKKILTILDKNKIKIKRIEADAKVGAMQIKMEIYIENIEKMEDLKLDIKTIDGVYSIK